MSSCKDGPQPEQWKIHVKGEDNDRLNELRAFRQDNEPDRRVHASEVIRWCVREQHALYIGILRNDPRQIGEISEGDR